MNTIYYRDITSDEWMSDTAEEIQNNGELSWGLPKSWLKRLSKGNEVYTHDYVFTTDVSEYERKLSETEIPKELDIYFQPSESLEWFRKTEKDMEKLTLMMNGFSHDYKGRLVRGEPVDFPLGRLKLVDTKFCPICHFPFRGLGGLSRRDNQTEICNHCAQDEAMMDYIFEANYQIEYGGLVIGSVPSVLEQKWNKVGLASISTYLPKWVKESFDLSWGSELNNSDLASLDMHVKQQHYENTSQWLKEKIRETIAETKQS